MESRNDDRCRCCGQRKDPAGRLGRGCGTMVMLLLMVVAAAPLLWLAREATEWALGI